MTWFALEVGGIDIASFDGLSEVEKFELGFALAPPMELRAPEPRLAALTACFPSPFMMGSIMRA